ncbi:MULTISPECIES: GtrA family protein [unclassified Rhizobium]|uniref:GtrA family protein n=1 Tax=unclassified Rhizobium TaxID=2613769 RepID=UPI0011606992|nr:MULTISPECIES: GtrA family protein [unclassified Rhizobium]TQX86922.1 GtrA family protein [Rhizobium sp. rho-13.1]TQY05590.1 GtrA family protein [Rhizobium sp. rho-1.1]
MVLVKEKRQLRLFSNELARYVIVGGTTAMIYFGLVLLLVEVFGLDGVLPVSISYIASVTFHFFSSKLFTFRVANGNISGQLIKYLIMVAINYLVTAVTVFLLVDYLRYPTYIGAGFAVAMTLVIGYALTKFWVFKLGRVHGG